MSDDHPLQSECCCCRRDFLQTVGTAAGGAMLLSGGALAATGPEAAPRTKQVATVRAAFLYPPPESLTKAGYWSWPGSSFDPVRRQKQYTAGLRAIEQRLGIRLVLDEKPIDTAADAAALLAAVKESKPDGILLIPLQKQHWQHVLEIVKQAGVPAVVLATLGVLLVDHIRQLHRQPGAYLVSSQDNLDAVEYGLRMIRTVRWMKEARLVSITGSKESEATVAHLGTRLRTIPHARFVAEYQRTEITAAVQELAGSYRKGAKEIVEPSPADILESARAYFALKRIAQQEQADAMMMECLSGLRIPHQHCPPCMGFMSLRDEGFPIGCQADLSSTLTLMLVQQLFGKPGFQQNAAMDTERNLYFGSHCTSPSKMNGPEGPAEPYALRSHAEAGWGCVPRVLFKQGQEVTMAQYLPRKEPQMLVYTGKIVGCPPIPPTGGCRTNLLLSINEVDDVCDVKGMHQIVFYGDHGKQLRAFCQMSGVEAVS
jgi:hypothetical protein